jgi:hypothetical protein
MDDYGCPPDEAEVLRASDLCLELLMPCVDLGGVVGV